VRGAGKGRTDTGLPQTPGAGGSFTEMLNDSAKMQAVFSSSTPKLSEPSQLEEGQDLDITPDLFTSPPLVKTQSCTGSDRQAGSQIPLTAVQCNRQSSTTSQNCDKQSPRLITGSQKLKRPLNDEDTENETKLLKITSAAEKSSQKMKRFKSESSIKDSNQLFNYASMNIFKKRDLGDRLDRGSIVQKGFDGLGGHTTHINPLGNPFKKPVRKMKSATKSSFTPALPKMDNYLVLD